MPLIEANRSCSNDADCATVAVSTPCFDACTRVVSATARDPVVQAIAQIGAEECGAYARGQCVRIVPPCAPPAPPRCVVQRCTD
jgi:hypothetical protein